MININFVNIDNSKMIGRLLPFWARGRKLSLLLQALLKPIISVHNKFKIWALDLFIECHITAQRSSIEWFLKYKLKEHLINENDQFTIDDGIDRTICCFSNDTWTNNFQWDNQMRWGSETKTLPWTNEETKEIFMQRINGIVVYAPAILTNLAYNNEDYERDIRYIMSKYMICFKKITIITNK